MPDITLRNNVISESNIGAIICRTPKVLCSYIEDGILVDNHCKLCENVDDLIKYFGDPFIDPSAYSDLTLVYDLLRRNIRVYVSSVDEMKDNDDGFKTPYNGYTEFYFLDNNKNITVGYKIKSDIKFCQPILRSSCKLNNLDIYASLYYLDRQRKISRDDINRIEPESLYKTYKLSFDINKDNDNSIIDALSDIGLELKILNSSSDTGLISILKSYSNLDVVLDQHDFPDLSYKYNLHTDNYNYDFSEDSIITDNYSDAINRLYDVKPEPLYLCLSKLYRSATAMNEDGSEPRYIVSSSMNELNVEMYYAIHSILLDRFSEDSNIYLFINAPDISVSSLHRWMTEEQNKVYLQEQFNCDIYYGSIVEYVKDSTYYARQHRLLLSASILTMCNLLLNNKSYITNSIGNLNIPSANVRSVILESTAKKFADCRCNSVVLFDTGLPSIYGNRSLSLLPDLRYSHISRNLVLIRRLVREYLETKKFSINTLYNVDSYVSYIESSILDQFIIDGILDRYEVTKSINDKTVYMSVNLYFSKFIESINLDFTI